MSDPMTYVDYERENTGRAWFHDPRPAKSQALVSVQITSLFSYVGKGGHPDAAGCGYVNLVSGSFENVTREQAKHLANALLRFSRKGTILKGRT